MAPPKLAAVRDALADGAATAETLRARFPDLAPHEIAGRLDVPVAETDDDPLVGRLWRFAEYRGRPARILLYSRGLAPLDGVIAGGLAARLLGLATPREVTWLSHPTKRLRAKRTSRPSDWRRHWRTAMRRSPRESRARAALRQSLSI